VGQKIHPTGFRIGINKKHKSNWFTNYSSYSQILERDFKIRKIFETNFPLLYKKAAITKLEISRKPNILEIFIYAAKPKIFQIDNEVTLLQFRNILKYKLKESKQIQIKIIQVSKMNAESLLIASSIADRLEKRVAFRKVIRQMALNLQTRNLKGFKIQIAGRLNGAEIARVEWIREGRVPLQTLRADINYASQNAYTVYGVLGIKVWIFNR